MTNGEQNLAAGEEEVRRQTEINREQQRQQEEEKERQEQERRQQEEPEVLVLDPPGAPPPKTPPPPITEEYDAAPRREWVRGTIALALIGILAAMVLASFVLLWAKPDHSDQLKELLSILFGPVVALVGAATGYYFGAGGSIGKGAAKP